MWQTKLIMVATTEYILSEVKNGVLIITINRPDKLNSLNKQTIEELHDTLVEAENINEINAIILTGAGQKPLWQVLILLSLQIFR